MANVDDDKSQAEVRPHRTLYEHLDRIPELINVKDIHQMIDIQMATLDRLDCTNKSLVNCSAMAQSKLAATTKLYKRTAKQILDSKKDLDVIYKKILDMKAKIRAERPELFKPKQKSDSRQKEEATAEQTSDAKPDHSDQ